MGSRTLLRKPKRVLCIGDLKDTIIIQNRDLVAPAFGFAGFDEDFDQHSEVAARVKTVRGLTVFDGQTKDDIAITHEIGIRYDPDVESEKWILFEDGNRVMVITVEDLEDRHEWMILLCVEKGSKEDETSKV